MDRSNSPENATDRRKTGGFLRRLARDRAGNTLAIIAASLGPLLALVGGGIDIGRAYLAETRLQQACDASVLIARKTLSASATPDSGITPEAQAIADRYFDLNFRDGAYGSQNRTFTMTLEASAAITGKATLQVPTSIMAIFGMERLDVNVACEAQTSMSNTDIMFVLDTTGSMNSTNSGDTSSRIDSLRKVVKDFHAQVEASKSATTRVRYGFVPYAINVNVGPLLKSDWMVDNWTYDSRIAKDTGTTTGTYYDYSSEQLSPPSSKVVGEWIDSGTCPSNTVVQTTDPTVEVSASPHVYYYEYEKNGDSYDCQPNDGGYKIRKTTYTAYRKRVTYTEDPSKSNQPIYNYDYLPRTFDVSVVKDASGDNPTIQWSTIDADTDSPTTPYTYWYHGCIEERSTYEITDYASVDLSKALDLDIDLVPTPGMPDTQWRPKFDGFSYARALNWGGGGSFSVAPVLDTSDEYLEPDWYSNWDVCPSLASKLAEMNTSEIANYVDNLEVGGYTYHDIGMIWGGRLLSPTGIFASENADVDGRTTTRHLIFLTDGQTMPNQIMDTAYGIEPLSQRRWSPSSTMNLTQTVEQRFLFACNEVKKKNITVWVIGFGTTLNSVMTECAGPGHFYEAANASQLQDVFSDIAGSIGELRITK